MILKSNNIEDILAAILAELAVAESKFPDWPTDWIHAAAIVAEEAGELTRACLQLTYEDEKVSWHEVEKEAIQTAEMAIRFLKNTASCRPCPQFPSNCESGAVDLDNILAENARLRAAIAIARRYAIIEYEDSPSCRIIASEMQEVLSTL